MRKSITSAIVLLIAVSVNIQAKGTFDLGRSAIFYDKADAEVESVVSSMLAGDIQSITGHKVSVSSAAPKGRNVVIIGTIDGNATIRRLISEGVIEVDGIKGQWERYAVRLLDNPLPGVTRALVIAGSDRRGAAYGALSLSEKAGVSPWVWWADVPVEKRKELKLEIEDHDSKGPAVKYRGVFINDEDWGLLPWASQTYEKEVGNIGPKTYARVFELLLRLKANCLTPAMHRRSKAFNSIPENKETADRYGIVMCSTHCEPLLYNNASEWDKKTMGEWNWLTNRETIERVLRERVENNCAYENVWTLALRGLHDKAMEGDTSLEARRATLQEALMWQRSLIGGYIDRPVEEIPQIFIPYKEVLDIYDKGLELPDDVTIVWPDDNFGYMKRVSNPREQKRSGRSGVYYHVSYHGKPHDYLWFSTTPPALMYEELSKVYKTGGDRFWVLNAGDIKLCEYSTDLFLRMAWDFGSFDYEKIADDHARWLASMFGESHLDDFRRLSCEFHRLAFSSKPEYMGWGQEWNRIHDKQARVTDTDWSFSSYREAQTRLDDYAALEKLSLEIMESLPNDAKAAYYELVHYPVAGSAQMNSMHLNAQKSRLYARQGRVSTAAASKESEDSFSSLEKLTEEYNSMLGGKWNGIASLRQGVTAHYFEKAPTASYKPSGRPELGVWADGEALVRGGSAHHRLPTFNRLLPQSHGFELFNRGTGTISWRIASADPWLIFDRTSGEFTDEERIELSVDWSKAPSRESTASSVSIVSNAGETVVEVSLFNPQDIDLKELDGLYLEDCGVVSIPAAGYHSKYENADIEIRSIKGLGYENECVVLGNPLAHPQNLRDKVPFVEYDFWSFNSGSVDVYTYTLPTFTLYDRDEFGGDFAGYDPSNGELKYGVSIDDVIVMSPSISSAEYSQAWTENVLHNCSVKKTTLSVAAPGRHSLKILCGDAGVVLQKIVIDFGGMGRSILGPRSTRFEAAGIADAAVGDASAAGTGVAVETPGILSGVLGEAVESAFHGRLSQFIDSPDSPAVALFDPASPEAKASSWKGEHAGKWLYAASMAVMRTEDGELEKTLRAVADRLISYQTPNGWLGCYEEPLRFHADAPEGCNNLSWDLWINSYMMKGMVAAYRATGEERYLECARKIADLMYDCFVVKGRSMADTGHHNGLVGTGTIEPLSQLYEIAPEPRYMELIRRCIREMETTPGLGLISKSAAGMDVSLIGDGKIYEMLRNFTGLARVGTLTGDQSLLDCCRNAWNDIRDHHLNPCGGPWGGVNVNNEVFNRSECFSPYGVCETCSSMEWLHFCRQMLLIDGEAKYAEEMEKTIYNAILGARKANGTDWLYYTRINGDVFPGNEWSCCWSSGMTAMEDIPWTVCSYGGKGDASINVYAPFCDGTLKLETAFPEDGHLSVSVLRALDGAIRLRIPQWAGNFSLKRNGRSCAFKYDRGYAVVGGGWKAGEKLELDFPVEYRLIKATMRYANDGKFALRLLPQEKTFAALAKGPVVYAVRGLRDTAEEPATATLKEADAATIASELDFVPVYKYAPSTDEAYRTVWFKLEK